MSVFHGITFDDKINLVSANHVDGGMENLYSELHLVQLGNISDKQKEVRITINVVKNSHHHKVTFLIFKYIIAVCNVSFRVLLFKLQVVLAVQFI